jgi:hypothetical protein
MLEKLTRKLNYGHHLVEAGLDCSQISPDEIPIVVWRKKLIRVLFYLI